MKKQLLGGMAAVQWVCSKVAKLLCYGVTDFLQSSFSQFKEGSTGEMQMCELRTTVRGELMPNSFTGLVPCFCMHCSRETAPPGFFLEPLSLLTLQAVKGTMKRTCKCHGVSGSCTTQTCWLQLPEFREVGTYLKERYHKALKVDLLQGAGNSAASRGAIAETFSSISKKELVHLEDSPDYCLENKTLGLLGTEGRECLKRGKALSKWEKRSCRRLCGDCGLAVEERRAEMVSSCNCKFHWCCAVRCEQCRKRVTKYFCVRKEKRERSGGGAASRKLKRKL